MFVVNLITSFDLKLEQFGVDVAPMQEPVTKRVFRAWVEDWEKTELNKYDPVIEARFLEKYKNLHFKIEDTGAITLLHHKMESSTGNRVNKVGI